MILFDLVVIGSEVLNGFTLDTNTQFLATELFDLGIPLNQVHTVRDDSKVILNKLKQLSRKGRFIITTGGLGPTSDDLTVDVLSKLIGVKPVYDSYAKRKAELFFKKRDKDNQSVSETNWDIILRQTRIPEGAFPLKNKVGIAPGVWLKDFLIISLPGFPIEIKSIWPEAKKIIQKLNLQRHYTSTISIWGLGESHVFSILEKEPSEVQLGVHALSFGCRLFLSSLNGEKLKSSTNKIKKLFSSHIVENPLLEVITSFCKKKYTMGTIESCTGGLIAKLITDQAGVSPIFDGSIICYNNQIKHSLIGVSESTLQNHGAVSEQVAYELAVGGFQKLNSTIILVTTGIAGPTGGSVDKPVGTVYVAIGDRLEKKIWVCKYFFPLGRERFRDITSYILFLNLYQKYIFFDSTLAWQKNGLGKNFKMFRLP